MKPLHIVFFILVAMLGVISVSVASDGHSGNKTLLALQSSELQQTIDLQKEQRFSSFDLQTESGVLRSRMFYYLLSNAEENLRMGNIRATRHYLNLAEQLTELPTKHNVPGVVQTRAFSHTSSQQAE